MARVYAKIESEEQWLEIRKYGIGGSDVGAICGVNPFSSPMEVFLKKVGKLPDTEMNEAMEHGRGLEQYIADYFFKKNKDEGLMSVAHPSEVYQSEENPFMLATVDRLVYFTDKGEGILEIKTAQSEWEEVPESYILQVQHYMYVLDVKYAFIAVLFHGSKYKQYFIERDDELIANMIKIEQDFWSRVEKYRRLETDLNKIIDMQNTVKEEPINSIEAETREYIDSLKSDVRSDIEAEMKALIPPIELQDDTRDIIKALYPVAEQDTIIELPQCEKDLENYLYWEAKEKEAKREKELAKAKIQLEMGEKETAFIGDATITWKNASRKEYTVPATTYRDFRIKLSKNKKVI